MGWASVLVVRLCGLGNALMSEVRQKTNRALNALCKDLVIELTFLVKNLN